MDCTAALESIAGLLASMPDESVEDLLVTFDGLVGVSAEGSRPAVVALLRKAAGSADEARRDRLLRAADAVEAAQPCALTADGLTVRQAAAGQTVTEEQWEAREALPPAAETQADDAEESPYMEEAPPTLPHLAVRHFFPGLVVRVARDFAEARGRAVCSGDLLTVLASEATDDGCTLSFLERRPVVLRDEIAGHDAILENSGNAWFQPVPTIACMEELADAIERSMGDVEQDDDEDDVLDALREDLEECERWLARGDERGPAPRLLSGRLATKAFGRDHELAAWIPLLFVCADRFRPDSTPYEAEAPEPMKIVPLKPSPAYQAFLSSMEISYSDWRDGAGYDLEALEGVAEAEKEAVVELLAGRLSVTPNWRDVEALGVIGTPAARAAIHRAVAHADTETRLRAAEVLADLGEPVDREAVIIDALRKSDLSSALSQAIDDAEENPSPRIQETLLELARNGNRDQRIHCAALALYAGGKADEAFDWNHRPFFLSFGEEDEGIRLEAYRELCRRLNVEPGV